jgi:hypothetical protein
MVTPHPLPAPLTSVSRNIEKAEATSYRAFANLLPCTLPLQIQALNAARLFIVDID